MIEIFQQIFLTWVSNKKLDGNMFRLFYFLRFFNKNILIYESRQLFADYLKKKEYSSNGQLGQSGIWLSISLTFQDNIICNRQSFAINLFLKTLWCSKKERRKRIQIEGETKNHFFLQSFSKLYSNWNTTTLRPNCLKPLWLRIYVLLSRNRKFHMTLLLKTKTVFGEK